MTIRVEGQDGLARALERIQARLSDFRPLWDRLDGGPFRRAAESPLAAEMRAVWDRRFGIGLRHAIRTVKERADARRGKGAGYYADHRPNARARDDAPYLEWTGSLREAASKFTTREPQRADIDPVAGYPKDGPLADEGGWDATYARFLSDGNVFEARRLEQMIESETERWLAEELAR